MADRVLMPRALDSNGDIVAGAMAYFFEVGTTTPLVVYTDSDGLTELGVSSAADATGTFPGVYTTEPLRLDIKDTEGVSLPGFPSDGWYVVPSNGVGAATITFEPQEGNEATNVQDAINNLTALWNAVTTYGRSLIAAVDAEAARVVLGLGSAATRNAEDALTNGSNLPDGAAVKAYVDGAVDSKAVGIGQTWQNLTGSRSSATSYQNTTGRSIEVAISVSGSDPLADIQTSTNGSTWVTIGRSGIGAAGTCSFVVPNGHYYRVNAASVAQIWAELR